MNLNQRRSYLIGTFLLAICLWFAIFVPKVEAATYHTDSFDVSVVAKEDNSFLVKEKIKVDFKTPQHGIFRVIPYARGKVAIENLEVSPSPFEASRVTYEGNDQVEIKIGDANKTVTGKNTYELSYVIRVLDQLNQKDDFLYLDLYPSFWESDASEVTMSLKMPRPIDWSEASYYSGKNGSMTLSDKFEIKAEGDKLFVKAKNVNAYEGFSVKSPLPNGYWQKNEALQSLLAKVLIALFVLFSLGYFILWYRYGRDKKVIPTIEFYPPKGYTSLELAYLLDETLERKNFFSLVPYFAHKGYLNIEIKGDNLILHRLCALSEVREKERSFVYEFFTMLFLNEETWVLDVGALSRFEKVNKKPEPTIKLRDEKLKKAMSSLAARYSSQEESLFSKTSLRLRNILGFVLCGFFLLPALFCSILIQDYIPWYDYLPVFACLIAVGGLLFLSQSRLTMKKSSMIGLVIFSFGLLGYAFWRNFILFETYLSQSLFVPFVLSFFLLLFFLLNMQKRNEDKLPLFGQILGFKQFLEVAEKERLTLLVKENPNYFYDILPYAYVFNLTHVWIDKFKDIEQVKPSWYEGSGNFKRDLYSLSTGTELLSSGLAYSESSGGRDSGGSGGGYGGGGGGAW